MASNIDPTKPADNVKADKSDLRNNLAAAKSEIEALQRTNKLAYRIAYGLAALNTL